MLAARTYYALALALAHTAPVPVVHSTGASTHGISHGVYYNPGCGLVGGVGQSKVVSGARLTKLQPSWGQVYNTINGK